MINRLLALLLVLVFSPFVNAQDGPVGTYKLVSFRSYYDDGTSTDLFGAMPVGYAVITPTRFITVLVGEGRKPGLAAEDKVALYKSLIAYSGTYKLEGARLITSVDVSWNQAWTGTAQGRTWKVEGQRLTLTTDKAPSFRDPKIMAYGTLVWEKIE